MSILSHTDLDLESVDLSSPLFTGAVKWIISSAKEDQKPGKPKRLVIELTLAEETKDTSGRTVYPGFKHTDSILLEEVGKLTKAMIAEKVARLQCSAFDTDRAKNGIAWSDYDGRTVIAQMTTKPDRNNPAVQRQEIARYVRASQVTQA